MKENINRQDPPKEESVSAQENPREASFVEEDVVVTEFVEANSEKIKQAAENWLVSEEQKLKNNDKTRFRIFSALGALAAMSITTVTLFPGGDPIDRMLATAIGYGISAIIGGTVGGGIGKVYNYFNRKINQGYDPNQTKRTTEHEDPRMFEHQKRETEHLVRKERIFE